MVKRILCFYELHPRATRCVKNVDPQGTEGNLLQGFPTTEISSIEKHRFSNMLELPFHPGPNITSQPLNAQVKDAASCFINFSLLYPNSDPWHAQAACMKQCQLFGPADLARETFDSVCIFGRVACILEDTASSRGDLHLTCPKMGSVVDDRRYNLTEMAELHGRATSYRFASWQSQTKWLYSLQSSEQSTNRPNRDL